MMRPNLVILPFIFLAGSSVGTWQLGNYLLSSLLLLPSSSCFFNFPPPPPLLLFLLPSFSTFIPFSFYPPLPSLPPCLFFLLPPSSSLCSPPSPLPSSSSIPSYAVVSDCITLYIMCCFLVLSHQLNRINHVFSFTILWKAEGSI